MPMHRIALLPNKLVKLVIQVQYHLGVIYGQMYVRTYRWRIPDLKTSYMALILTDQKILANVYSYMSSKNHISTK